MTLAVPISYLYMVLLICVVVCCYFVINIVIITIKNHHINWYIEKK